MLFDPSLDFSYRLAGVNGAGIGWLVMSIVAGGYDKLPMSLGGRAFQSLWSLASRRVWGFAV